MDTTRFITQFNFLTHVYFNLKIIHSDSKTAILDFTSLALLKASTYLSIVKLLITIFGGARCVVLLHRQSMVHSTMKI